MQVCGQAQHIPYPHAVVEHGFRGQIADLSQKGGLILPDILSENLRPSAGGGNQAKEDADGGTFARAVGADEAEEVSFFHGESHIRDSPGFAVVFF